MRSPAIHSTEPQSIDFSNQSPMTESINRKNLISIEKANDQPKEIEDENSGPITISALGKNVHINDSEDEQEPQNRISIELGMPSEENTIQIETRYCPICTIEQPLRAKHCKDCNVCIALYDHHCPWTGNCVGERNRFYF
jgi:Uncharacterized protein containing DHHC-type Zn finger